MIQIKKLIFILVLVLSAVPSNAQLRVWNFHINTSIDRGYLLNDYDSRRREERLQNTNGYYWKETESFQPNGFHINLGLSTPIIKALHLHAVAGYSQSTHSYSAFNVVGGQNFVNEDESYQNTRVQQLVSGIGFTYLPELSNGDYLIVGLSFRLNYLSYYHIDYKYKSGDGERLYRREETDKEIRYRLSIINSNDTITNEGQSSRIDDGLMRINYGLNGQFGYLWNVSENLLFQLAIHVSYNVTPIADVNSNLQAHAVSPDHLNHPSEADIHPFTYGLHAGIIIPFGKKKRTRRGHGLY